MGPKATGFYAAGVDARQATTEIDKTKKDEAQGRIKRAVEDLTDDADLRREGKTDQAAGKVKDAVDSAADKAKDVFRKQ